MAKDYLSSVLGIFDNTKELARRKAEEARIAAQQKAAQMAASAKRFVTQTAPQAIQRKSEQYIPGGIKGGADRVKTLFNGQAKDSPFIFAPKNLNNQAKFVQQTAGQSKSAPVRATASAYTELLKGKAKGATNIQEGVKQSFQQPGWFNKAKGVAKTATGAWQFAAPDIAVATGPVRAAVAGGAGAIIRGAMAKIQGKDVAEEAGKGLTEGVRFAAVTKFTDPLISKAAGAVAPALGFWGKQAATRAITGVGNVIEDEIISRIEQDKPANADRAISLAIGVALGGNDELFDQVKRQVTTMLGKNTDTKSIAKVTKEVVERTRDHGRYAPEPVKPAVPEPKADWIAPDPNKPNNLVRTIDGVPETPLNPQPKPPVSNMDFSQDPNRPRTLLRQPQQAAFGLMAGIEPEVDENGQPTGKMKYNPEKGLAGLAMAGFLTTGKHQESMKAIINGSKTPEEAIGQLKNYVETSLKEVSAKLQAGDTSKQTINDAKGLRAAINKLAYQIAGVDPAAGKQEKVFYEAAKNDPDAGPVIDELEWQITNVDGILAGQKTADTFGRPDMGTAPTTEIPPISTKPVVDQAGDAIDRATRLSEIVRVGKFENPPLSPEIVDNFKKISDQITSEMDDPQTTEKMGKMLSYLEKYRNVNNLDDAEVNGLFSDTKNLIDKIVREDDLYQRDDTGPAKAIFDKVFDAVKQADGSGDRLDKVLAIDRFVNAVHQDYPTSLLPRTFDIQDPIVAGEAVVNFLDFAAGGRDNSSMVKNIMEMRSSVDKKTQDKMLEQKLNSMSDEEATAFLEGKPAAKPRKTAQQVIDEANAKALNPEDYKGATASEFNRPQTPAEMGNSAVRKPKSAQEIIASQSQGSIPKTDTPQPSPAPKMQEFFQTPKAPDTQIQPKSVDQITPNTAPSEISISRKTTQASPLNVNRLDLTDEQKGRVSADQIREVRDILGDKEIEKIAKAAGIDTKTNSIDQTAEKIAGQLNVRRQVVELETKRTEMIKAGASDEELIAIAKQIQDTSRISREQGTDIARQLSARRIIANEINTPMQRVFQLLDKAGVNPEAYTKDAAKLDFTNGNAVVDFYRKYVPPKAEDWLTLVRYNSMLSSPNTQINNFFSNLQGSLLIAPIEKEVTAGIDAIKSALTGSKRQYASGEGIAYAKGYLESVGAAVKKFSEVMQGKVLSSNLDYREVPLTQSGDRLRKTENILKFPMKTLEAFDQFFTTLTKGGSEKSLEFRAGKGIAVKDAAAQAEEEAAKRLFRSDLGDNEGSVVLDAMDAIANVVQRLKGHDNVVVRNVARFSLPFLRTPTNILKQGLEYSPAGVLTMPGAKDKTEQLAKAVMGTSVGIAVATMVSSDRLTWAEPTSQKQKNAFRAAGMQPYSIKVGDKWISYSKVHPAVAFPMALVAAVKDSQENGNLDDTQADQILAGASKWVQFFADQSYVKSIGDLVASTKGDIEGPARMLGNYAQQLIPFRAMSGWIARLIDPYQRKVDTDGSQLQQQFDYIKTQIPWASMTVPAREDQFGKPIDNNNRFMNAFSPNKVTIEKPAAKKEFEWMQEQSKMDKEQRQLKEKLDREIKTTTTVPKAGAAESPLVPGTGAIEPKKVAMKELTKQEKTKVKTMLEYGKDVPEDDLVSYYLSDVKGEATDTGYKKSIRTKSLLTKYESIDTDENLSKAQKEVVKSAIAAETGLTAERMDYYQTAKMDNSLKYEKAMEDIASFNDRKQIVQYLVEGRASVAGQMFATPGVIDSFYEDGYITKDEAKYLKALKWDETKKKMGQDRDYKGSGTGGNGGMTKTEMKAFFKKVAKGPELTAAPKTKQSQVDWSNIADSSNVSEEDATIKRPKAYQTPEKMVTFFKPKATKLSTGEAQAAVNAVRGRGPANSRLKLNYARVSR